MHQAAHSIRQWRRSQTPPISATKFARMVGISPTQAYRIESGLLPHGDVMVRIQKLGACAPEDWFTEHGRSAPRAA